MNDSAMNTSAQAPDPAPGSAPASAPPDRPDLGPVAEGVARLLPGVPDERLDGPTPCPEYAVRDLLGHLHGLSAAFRDAARKDLGPNTSTDPGSHRPVLPADWRTSLPALLTDLAAAWRVPDAWDGMTQAGGVTFPASDAGMVALNELLVHGWDLARATDQPYAPDPASLAVSRALLTPQEPDGPDGASEPDGAGNGLFGPVVPVPDDAPELDRVVGLSGRHPDWTPRP
ncbi:TIGR03086 family metal-binding protein [Streptomyces sp. NPDC005805]|uniref:TIGR03086 family metal-binding protein n=1 Tax=Streptomyces sp. NPDC005805 TaxID=3157068 RepID=UPI0033D66B40